MAEQAQAWDLLATSTLASGRSSFECGDHVPAIDAYTTALTAFDPDDANGQQRALAAQLFLQRGHARFIRRDLPAAAEDYSQALQLDAALAEAFASRGLVAYQSGKAIAAVADFSAAIRLYHGAHAGDETTISELAELHFNRGNANYQRRDYTAAIGDYTQVLCLQPGRIDALIYRGVARFELGEDADADDDYARVLQEPGASDLQRAGAAYNRGLLLRRQGDLIGAIGSYNLALTLQPNSADCLMNRGNAFAEVGDLERAIEDYGAALRLNPWLDDGFNIRGMARLSIGDLKGAIDDFGRAIAAAPLAPHLHFNRGCARLQFGDLDGAIADFGTELGRQAPGLKGRVETRERRAQIYNNRGLAYHYQGEFGRAIEDYGRSFEQLRLCGAAQSESAASTFLNRGLASRDQALASLRGVAQQAHLRAAVADLEQARALTRDFVTEQEVRRHLAEIQRYLLVGAA